MTDKTKCKELKDFTDGNPSGELAEKLAELRATVEKLEQSGTIETTEDYWDCECPNNYIHPRSDEYCSRCDAREEDQPDSRVSEVELWKKGLL